MYMYVTSGTPLGLHKHVFASEVEMVYFPFKLYELSVSQVIR